MARRKCLFLSSIVFYSSQKMNTCFLFLEEEGQKYVIFLTGLTQQSFRARNELVFFSAFSKLYVKEVCLIINLAGSSRFSVVWLCCDYWWKPLITVYSLCSCLEIGLRVSGSSRSPLPILLKQYCWTEPLFSLCCALSAAQYE